MIIGSRVDGLLSCFDGLFKTLHLSYSFIPESKVEADLLNSIRNIATDGTSGQQLREEASTTKQSKQQ
jgi:hypothetical protein